MKINLVCVGTKMPDWVASGVAEYQKRLPRDFELLITEIPMAQRGKGVDVVRAVDKEGESCLRMVGHNDYLIALDVKGRVMSTEQMAAEVRYLRDSSRNICMLVGGPDGLSPRCLETAAARWSLSLLTFPHPVVRIILAEQLYSVWSILGNHPYHRA